MKPAKIGARHWGRQVARIFGLPAWKKQDHAKSWGDNGASKAILESLIPKIHALIAENVKDGVAEYAESGEFALCAREGQLWVDLRLWNDTATLMVGIPVREIFNAAIAESYKALGADPSAQEFISLVFALGRDITKVEATVMRQKPQPTREVA